MAASWAASIRPERVIGGQTFRVGRAERTISQGLRGCQQQDRRWVTAGRRPGRSPTGPVSAGAGPTERAAGRGGHRSGGRMPPFRMSVFRGPLLCMPIGSRTRPSSAARRRRRRWMWWERERKRERESWGWWPARSGRSHVDGRGRGPLLLRSATRSWQWSSGDRGWW